MQIRLQRCAKGYEARGTCEDMYVRFQGEKRKNDEEGP